MKKTVMLFIVSLCFCTTSFAQKVPQAVKDTFAAKFQNAESVKWDKENSTDYEANFKLDGVEMSSVFSGDGTWKETETAIDVNTLPQPVLDSVKTNYSSGKLVGASRIVRSDSTVIYETDIKTGKKKKEVLFDEKGNVLE